MDGLEGGWINRQMNRVKDRQLNGKMTRQI